jgi:hypothetical protein
MMKVMRYLLIASTAASLFLTSSAPARSPVDAVNKNGQSVALKGYDPVAYFEQGRPIKGSPQFSHRWMEATWWFATAEHRDLFTKDPQKYAPQFGGYCAYAVSEGYTANIDPEAWKIVDGKLYLNYSRGVQKKWEEDLQRRIQAAEKNWPALHK